MNRLFFVAIVLPEPVRSQVESLKQRWAKKYGVDHALNAPPHITILPPFQHSKVGILKQEVSRLALRLNPFTITLAGWGRFSKRVIYLRPKAPELEDVFHLFRDECRWIEGIQFFKRSSFVPHITLAHRDLSPALFDVVWGELGKPMTGNFWVHQIALLEHNGKAWEIVEEFSFGGKQSILPIN